MVKKITSDKKDQVQEKSEKTIMWNDPKINIKWPNRNFILSKKDKHGEKLEKAIV